MQDPCLQAALLRHPDIANDQQVVAALQQTSSELQAALAELAAGQLCVRLSHITLHQTQAFARWLRKHAALLQDLQLECCTCCTRGSAPAWAALQAGFQQAAARSTLQLQSLSIFESPVAEQGILQHLPAAHLTYLDAPVDLALSSSFQAVAALSGLRRLDLAGASAAQASDDVLARLTAGLQQLTELHIQLVRPAQLLHLPPHLQQLHITVGLESEKQMTELGNWLLQDKGIVHSLGVQICGRRHDEAPGEWAAVLDALASGLEKACQPAAQAAAGTAAAAAAAAGPATASAAVGPLRNLQSLTLKYHCLGTAGTLLKQLPASSLTRLACCLDWSSNAELAALCSLTWLRRLTLDPYRGGPGARTLDHPGAGTMLAQLSAMQQLTYLDIPSPIDRVQLQNLQLLQLQLLRAHIWGTQGPHGQLQLGHLTSVQVLILSTGRQRVLRPDDTLPPNVRQLFVLGSTGIKGQDRNTSCSWEPLQQLSKLEQLDARFLPGEPKETGKLAKLAAFCSLRRVELTYRCHTIGGAGNDSAAAWGKLPVKVLRFNASVYGKALVQQLGKLQGLEELALGAGPGLTSAEVKATIEQLAAALQQLTTLRSLRLEGLASIAIAKAQDGSAVTHHDAGGVAAVLRAIGSMRKLVSLHVRLADAAVQQLRGSLGQLLPSWMVPYCSVQGDKVSIEL
jgi:hypothetical protein